MNQKTKSERNLVVDRIADWVRANNLAQIYGGEVRQEKGLRGKPYSVGFSIRRDLDGEIKVYSPKFILIKWQTAIRDLPPEESRVFESEGNALNFLDACFVNRDVEKAYAVPYKQSQRTSRG